MKHLQQRSNLILLDAGVLGYGFKTQVYLDMGSQPKQAKVVIYN